MTIAFKKGSYVLNPIIQLNKKYLLTLIPLTIMHLSLSKALRFAQCEVLLVPTLPSITILT